MSKDNSSVMIGVLLIGGAYLYSKSATAAATAARPTGLPYGTGSMPASAGTGVNQVVGGILGSLYSLIRGGPGVPRSGIAYDPVNPANVIGTQDLVNGTIRDYYQGDNSSYAIPTTGEIGDSVISGMYNPSGNGGYGSDSIIANPDYAGYW